MLMTWRRRPTENLRRKVHNRGQNPYSLSLCELQAEIASGTENILAEALQKAKVVLLVILKYRIKESEPKHMGPKAQRGYYSSDEESKEDDNDNEGGK